MFRTIARIISVGLVIFCVLWFVDSSYTKFARDIDLKNPFDVFNVQKPDIQKPKVDTPNVSKPETSSENPKPVENTDKKDDSKKTDESNSKKTRGITEKELNYLISSIRVSKENQNKKYNRNEYENPYKQYTYKGQKLSRNKYAWHISRHLVREQPFEYKCPYTGLTITDPKILDFDHILAIGYVHKFGDVNWSNEEKNKYSYDIYIGVDVLNKSNRSKSDKGPSEWLPDSNIASYCYSWLKIASEYDIAMRKIDIDVCKLECLNDLEHCEMINKVTIEPEDITKKGE